jgi:hypothetical protein
MSQLETIPAAVLGGEREGELGVDLGGHGSELGLGR